jgi:large subunit ribosomal protein L5
MTERLQRLYHQSIIPNLINKMGYRNVYQVPYLSKIVVNRGVGEASYNSKVLDGSLDELSTICGQKSVQTVSTKSIAAFKLRPNTAVGVKVTLRDFKMYAFLDRLISLALPRIRDFRGTSPYSFDHHGNYSLGVKEQLVFPEIKYDSIDKIRGLDIAIVTTAKSDVEGYQLLRLLGMPFNDIYG